MAAEARAVCFALLCETSTAYTYYYYYTPVAVAPSAIVQGERACLQSRPLCGCCPLRREGTKEKENLLHAALFSFFFIPSLFLLLFLSFLPSPAEYSHMHYYSATKELKDRRTDAETMEHYFRLLLLQREISMQICLWSANCQRFI
jgi:hypothetical protein